MQKLNFPIILHYGFTIILISISIILSINICQYRSTAQRQSDHAFINRELQAIVYDDLHNPACPHTKAADGRIQGCLTDEQLGHLDEIDIYINE